MSKYVLRSAIYRIRYALHLWRNVRDMTLREAWAYPCDMTGDGDPIEDAEAEISCMHE